MPARQLCRAVTAGVALRLAPFFGTTPGFWSNMQKCYELDMAEEEAEAARREIQPMEAA